MVLVGVPLLLLLVGPLLKPLQRRNLAQREMMGALSNLATDIVSGLRVLRGIGGERVFHERYVRDSQQVRQAGVQVGRLQSVLDAVQVLLPGVFVVLVVWLGARFAVQGRISAGELVAFYGYAAFLMLPLRTATEFANKWIRAHVSAHRVVRVLALQPEVVDPTRRTAGCTTSRRTTRSWSTYRAGCGCRTGWSPRSSRTGPRRPRSWRTGWVVTPTARCGGVTSRCPVSPAASCGAGSWCSDAEHLVVLRGAAASRSTSGDAGDGGRSRPRCARRPRRTCSTRCRTGSTPWSPSGAGRSPAASGSGWCSPACWPPTRRCWCWSSRRRRSTRTPRRASRTGCVAHRAGRTTVVTTTSPLLLDRVDQVAFLRGGSVVAFGTHRDLLRDVPDYRAVVTREVADDVTEEVSA